MPDAIEFTHVTRRFGSVTAVDDLTIQIPEGSITVLLGPNGAGKTTTVRLATGALQCDEGDDFQTFRIGLFGLDKLHNIDRTVASLEAALDGIGELS